ncbi:DBF4-type zinc finger-containing protein 2 isoform X2 [Peromyscus leucopus]|uniref:DBF4-type zinc finger-containing protein 2 isoform X2 n=1 Tax=Peromyscus leucopus TaxID=10041 RepID=UPI0018854F20|nr:DBF4-type zinc finger-containing protein 2 isoform X2 [Peromyscus leucopus]
MEAQSYQEVMKNNGQHLFSAQHRSLTRQSRRRTATSNTLMERFLQDVLRHHPYNYQDNNGPAPDEAAAAAAGAVEGAAMAEGAAAEGAVAAAAAAAEGAAAAAAAAANPESPEVVVLDDSDEKEDDTTESTGEQNSEDSESVEEIDCRPGTSQECAEVAVRPSVIQRLERGQQQPLELAQEVESGVERVNSVGVQATTSGKELVRPPVICNAPARSLPRGSERPVAATSAPRLVLAVASDSFPACDTENLETYFDSPDQGTSNPPSQPETKDPKKKPLNINLDKLLAQKNLRAQGASFSPVVRVRELTGDELCSVRAGPSSEAGEGTSGNPSETDTLARALREGAIPKRRGEASRSNVVRPREETCLVFNRQERPVSSEVTFQRGSLQLVPGHSQAAVHDLRYLEEEEEEEEEEEDEEGPDQEDESYESRGSDTSFDSESSGQSPSALSELTAREINGSEETHADNVQPQDETPTVSGAPSDNGSSSHQVSTNRSPVITQNIQLISLVDESYESSGSEENFDGDDSLPSTSHHPPQPMRAASLRTQMAIRLVDSYGSGSSEACEDSGSSADETPAAAAAGQQQPPKNAHAHLVDENYGSSSFSSDSDAAPQMPAQERSPRDRAGQQENEPQPSSAEAQPERDGSLETVADEPQREAEEINVPNQSTSRGDMNCESHGPEMGFHADAQLEADQSPLNPEEVDLDLENQSVHSGISNLSSDSRASYQSANDQPQGAWGEVNLDELNVDMEVKSNGCSSSELTFDSDSPLLSVTERSLLDVEGINEDDFNLEDESCVSSSSYITFDSDIPDDSVADQPQVAVYEEEPVDLENKSNASCVSEITYDSDIPLHSGNDHPEVAVKEVIIQEEENVHLEGKNDSPSGSEICLDSNAPLHSVTNSDVAVEKINFPNDEQVHIEQKENEPTDSELDTLNSKPGRSEDPIIVRASETTLDSHIPFQSVIRKCEIIVKNVCPPKEKHAQLPSQSTESHSEINSASSSAPQAVTEPYVGKKAKRKTKHLEEVKSDDEYDCPPTFHSDGLPQLMTEKPQPAALNEDHADPKDESTDGSLNASGCLDSVISQPQPAEKEDHVELEDTNGQPSDSKASVDSPSHCQSPPKDDVITKMSQWKNEAKDLEKKISELIYSKLMHDSSVSFRSAMDHLELALKQINLDSNDQLPSEDNSQDASSETNLHSDLSVQAVVGAPEITVSEPEHVELEGRNNESCDSNDSAQSEADQHSDSEEDQSQKDKEDTEGKKDEVQGLGNTCVSNVPEPLAGQTEVEVVQESSHWKEQGDLEDTVGESIDSQSNLHSDEPLQSVTNTTQEPAQEIHLLRGHVRPHDSDCEPCDSEIVAISNVIFCSVTRKPQCLQTECTSLKVKSSSPCGPEVSVDSHDGPETSLDSSDPCQSVAGHPQKTVKEMTLKEDHIYLEDKSYRLVDFEPTYYPDDPVQLLTYPSVEDASITEVNLQRETHNDLENETFQPCCSEVPCSSGVHLQSEVDPPQVACTVADLEKKEPDIEEKYNESCEPEMLYDSDVSFQIVVNQLQTADDGEADSPQVVFVDVVASDSDCDREVISDSNIPLQLETEPPQLTARETNEINTDSAGSAAMEKYYCRFCGCDYEASQSVTNQSKESFKIINRKNDYIILGDSTCSSCGHELNFNVDASEQPTTCQLQEPDGNCIAPEVTNYDSNCPDASEQPTTCQLQEPDGNCIAPEVTNYDSNCHDASEQPTTCQLQEPDGNCIAPEVTNYDSNCHDASEQPTTCQLQGTDRSSVDPEVKKNVSNPHKRRFTSEDTVRSASPWREPRSLTCRDRNWESSCFAPGSSFCSVSVMGRTTVMHIPLKIPDEDLENPSDLHIYYDSDNDEPQPAKKARSSKKVTFDMKVTKYEYEEFEEMEEEEEFAELFLEVPPQGLPPLVVVTPRCQMSETPLVVVTPRCQMSQTPLVVETPRCQMSETPLVVETPRCQMSETPLVVVTPRCQMSEAQSVVGTAWSQMSETPLVVETPRCQVREAGSVVVTPRSQMSETPLVFEAPPCQMSEARSVVGTTRSQMSETPLVVETPRCQMREAGSVVGTTWSQMSETPLVVETPRSQMSETPLVFEAPPCQMSEAQSVVGTAWSQMSETPLVVETPRSQMSETPLVFEAPPCQMSEAQSVVGTAWSQMSETPLVFEAPPCQMSEARSVVGTTRSQMSETPLVVETPRCQMREAGSVVGTTWSQMSETPLVVETPRSQMSETPLVFEAPPCQMSEAQSVVGTAWSQMSETPLVVETPRSQMSETPLVFEAPPCQMSEARSVVGTAWSQMSETPLVVETPRCQMSQTPLVVETPRSQMSQTPLVVETPRCQMREAGSVVVTPQSQMSETPLVVETPRCQVRKPRSVVGTARSQMSEAPLVVETPRCQMRKPRSVVGTARSQMSEAPLVVETPRCQVRKPRSVVGTARSQMSKAGSVVGKTRSRMRKNEVKSNAQESQGHLSSCSKTKIILLGAKEKTACSDNNQSTSVLALPHLEYIEGQVGDTNDVSVAVGKPSCSLAEGLHQQHGHVASENQVEGVRCGTQARSRKKRKTAGQEQLTKGKHSQPDSQKKKTRTKKTKSPKPQTKASEPVQPDNLVSIFSSLTMKEDQSLKLPRKRAGRERDLRLLYSCKEHSAPSPVHKKPVTNPPQTAAVADQDKREVAGSGLSKTDPTPSAGESGADRPSVVSRAILAMPKKRIVFRILGESQSSPPENSGAVPAIPKDKSPKENEHSKLINVNLQQTLSNRDSPRIIPKLILKEVIDSKNHKRFWKKKMAATHQSSLLQNAYKTVVLRKRSKFSEKMALWLQLIATDIVRKYVRGRSFTRHRRRQSKTVFIRMQLRKKKIVARKIKEAKRAAAEARARARARSRSRLCVVSVVPAVPEEPQPSSSAAAAAAAAGPALLPAVSPAANAAAGVKRYRKTYRRRKKKKQLPVREYDLRSSSSTSTSNAADRMVTRRRRTSKSRSNEAK